MVLSRRISLTTGPADREELLALLDNLDRLHDRNAIDGHTCSVLKLNLVRRFTAAPPARSRATSDPRGLRRALPVQMGSRSLLTFLGRLL